MTFRQKRLLYLLIQIAGVAYFGSKGDMWMTAFLAWCVGTNMKCVMGPWPEEREEWERE